MKIQIDNNYFLAKNISIQYTIDDTVDTKISLDSNINKTNLYNILDNKKKFNIKSSNFEIINCFMRYISNSDNNTDIIILHLNGELIQNSTINRRNEIINQLLK
jgi:hypothetical protein